MKDWKLILMKYINHVGNCEGTSFINGSKPDSFTDEEWSSLKEALSDSYGIENES